MPLEVVSLRRQLEIIFPITLQRVLREKVQMGALTKYHLNRSDRGQVAQD